MIAIRILANFSDNSAAETCLQAVLLVASAKSTST